MKRLSALAVTAIVALSACSGGGSTAPRNSAALVPNSTSSTLRPYLIPLVHSASLDASAALGAKQRGLRMPSSIGSLPTITIIDAPRFGVGAQINIALVAVQAIGATDGITYTVTNYATPQIVNMLAYQTSALVLGQADIPSQDYTVRLLVKGSASTLFSKNVTYPVQFGSYDRDHTFTANPSDLSAIDFPASVSSSTGAMTVLADFNMVESVKLSNGVAKMGSRVAAQPYNTSAVIQGKVINNATLPVGSAIVAALDSFNNVAATTQANDDGTFELHALAGGTYHLVVYNDYTSAAGDQLVSNGADSALMLSGPTVSVPAGYLINVGNIVD